MTILVQGVFAADPSPNPGLGVLTIAGGTQDANGFWIVNPGAMYTFNLTEVQYDHADISVHGSYTDGSTWVIVIGTDIAATGTMSPRGWYYEFDVTIPTGAGCTGTVHYDKGATDGSGNPDSKTHVAAKDPAAVWNPNTTDSGQIPGHFKTYYPATSTPIPCGVNGVPEFPFPAAVATSLGLLGAILLRRRHKA